MLTLLDVYRRYYGWRMALYIGAVFFVTMVLAGIIMDVIFRAFHQLPPPNTNIRAQMELFSFNYTFWLNLMFGAVAVYLGYLNWKNPMMHHHEAHEHAHAS